MTMCDDRDDVLHNLPYIKNTVTIVTTVTLMYVERIITMNEELMNTPINRWGIAWQRFMETNYPDEIPQLKTNGRWEVIPRLIDRDAWQMWELLRNQYAAQNPRPKTFVEIAVWEKTRSLVVEHEVMEQVVLQYRE